MTPDCRPCATAAECDDGDICTDETCASGVCGHQAVADCTACTTADTCDDRNRCTTDTCGTSGSCEHTTSDHCRPCTTDGDCDDADACTTDRCGDGVCTAEPVDSCNVEDCQDGADNDGDATVDCDDSDCANDPACAVEVCGDCQDNDADGLVDYEDPDCCQHGDTLRMRRMVMKMRSTNHRLRLRTGALNALPHAFDPARDGVTLQIADSDGQVLCETLSLKGSKRSLQRGIFRFRDKTGELAAGLRTARLKIRKSGRVVFRAKGSKMTYRMPASHDMTVTLRVGEMCAQAVTPMRSRVQKSGMRLRYP